MKKEWTNPVVEAAGVRETKENNYTCQYRSDEMSAVFSMLTAEQCCPCTDPGLLTCTKSWRYTGPCNS